MHVADMAEQFAGYIEREHKRFHYETDFYALADAMGILVKSGPFHLASAGPPAYILLKQSGI